MAAAIATGRPLLDERICGLNLTALYVNAEDSTIEMRRRIFAFCLKHGVREQDLDRFFLLGADDVRTQKVSFLRSDKGNSVLDDAGIAQLEALLEEYRPAVLILDPLVALCGGGNLNDNAAMSLVLRTLKRFANKFNCAILILHHTRKGGDLTNAEAIGGASAIVNLSRRAVMIASMDADEATKLGVLPSEQFSYFKALGSKSNLVPNSTDTPWYKLDSVTLPNPEPPMYPTGDGVQAVTRVYLPVINAASSNDEQQIRRAILDTIEHGAKMNGQNVPYSPNVAGARNQRTVTDDAMAAVKAATAPRTWLDIDLRSVVKRTIGSLCQDGWIVTDDIKTGPARRRKGLRVEWGRTPWALERQAQLGDLPPAESPAMSEAG